MTPRHLRLLDAIQTLIEERYPSASVTRSTHPERTAFQVVDNADPGASKEIEVMHAFLDERTWHPDDLRTFILESRYFDVVDAASEHERVIFAREAIFKEIRPESP